MKVGIDAHAIGLRQTGNETYVRNLLRHLARLAPEVEWWGFVSKGVVAPSWDGVRWAVVSRSPWKRLGWDLPRAVSRCRLDALHVQYTAPLACSCRLVVTVHDVSYLERPQLVPALRRLQLRWTVRSTLARAGAVITGSEFSRQAISRVYGLPASRIEVIPMAADPCFRPLEREEARSRVRWRFGVHRPFILTVGNIQPRKNQLGLVQAFADLVRRHPELPHELALVGKLTSHAATVQAEIRRLGLRDRVRVLGYVSETDLVDLYNAAEVFVFPSLYEGFGLPILEAMACGRAVVCSKCTAMPEVAGPAAAYFDPLVAGELCRVLASVLNDADYRLKLEVAGRDRAARFDWFKTAEKTLNVYRRVAGEERPGLPHSRPAVMGR